MNKLIGFFIAVFAPAFSNAQSQAGNWEGTLDAAGKKIPIIFHISSGKDGKYSATFDSPSQQAFNLACGEVTVHSDSVVVQMPVINGKYSGLLKAGGKELIGKWHQGGMSMPLNLVRTGEVTMPKKVIRPQDPVPPFPYKSEDLIYYNADRSIRFGATFTVPLPDSGVEYFRAPVYPTVLLITGSGMQDRDESLMNHRPFAVIADFLSRRGIAVLRVDDRGMGKSTGNFSKATTADFADDVEAGINFLKTRKEVDTTQLGLLGHSEGGMIAPIVASRRADVNFIILLAGPGVKISELLEQQVVDVSISEGASSKNMEAYRPLYRELLRISLAEKDSNAAKEKAMSAFSEWKKGKRKKLVKQVTGVTDEISQAAYIAETLRPLRLPWFDYFLRFDPAVYLEKTKCPVLALNGEKDVQVSAKPNLQGIETVLKRSGNNRFTIREMPGLNHLFQHCKKCTVSEYGELDETIAYEVLKTVVNWIKNGTQ